MSATALVFPYPSEGAMPAFVVRGRHVYPYSDQSNASHWVHDQFWYEYPDGKEPVFFRKDDYLYDYPASGEAKYLIREGALQGARETK